jgi:hypothetical protein
VPLREADNEKEGVPELDGVWVTLPVTLCVIAVPVPVAVPDGVPELDAV